ncbi:MAG: DUF4365 domain-containing protein [Candidatus Bathyarchaeia archaeon]|jgi:hypothetical protein
MERPPQHVTETESIKIFDQAIPSEWINRTINLDYGLDKSVEVTENGKLTGKELLVQLKGTNTINITDGCVSYPLEVKNLKYYLQRDLPVVLTVVEVTSRKCYWLFIQQYIFEVLDESNPNWTSQGTVTVKIPVSNDIASTLPQLKDVALGGSTYILSKRLDKIPIEHLEHWKDNSEAISKLMQVDKKLLDKQFQIKFDVAYRLQKENSYEQSFKLLLKIAEQAKSQDDTSTQIKAILVAVYSLNPLGDSEQIVELLESIGELVQKSGDLSFELMWRSEYLETIFATLIKKLNSTRMMFAVATHAPQGTMAPFLGVEIGKIISGLYEVENDFINLLERANQNKEITIYLDLLRRLSKMQFIWCYNNSLEGNPTIIFSQIDSIKKTLLSALELATQMSLDIEFEIFLDLANICNSVEDNESRDKYLKSAMELAKKLDHKGFQSAVQSTQERLKKSYSIPTMIKAKGTRVNTEEDITDEEEEKVAKKLLEIGGIDIKGNDELAKIARIGLKDRNPERVLKYCENLHTEVVNWGPIWEMVGLLTTGMKILFCEKKGVSIMGFELDILLEDMKKDCCASCSDLCPRPADWKWTHEWHKSRAQPLLMKKTIHNYLRS